MNRLEQLVQKNEGKILTGASVMSYYPEFVDMAGIMGFDIIWIEMEHAFISFKEAANLCRIASGTGMLSMIRIPDTRRENVLHAAECGPDIIDVPMANSPEILEELVRYARYAPEGERGFFGASRAIKYGLYQDVVEERKRINEELCLMGQIETAEAVMWAEGLCGVEGIDAVFLGLGDLSASMGLTGQTRHPKVFEAADRVIEIAKERNKLVAVAGAPSDAGMWRQKKADILFCTSDIMSLRLGLKAVKDDVTNSLEG